MYEGMPPRQRDSLPFCAEWLDAVQELLCVLPEWHLYMHIMSQEAVHV